MPRYVLRTLFVLTDIGNSLAMSPFENINNTPLLPSSTKIDDVYTHYAAIESPPGHWSRGPALEAVIGSCLRQLCTLYL